MTSDVGDGLTYSDVTVMLLTELQDVQDLDLAKAIHKIHTMVRILKIMVLCGEERCPHSKISVTSFRHFSIFAQLIVL